MTGLDQLSDMRRRLDALRREIDQLARREVGSGSQDGSLTGGGTVATGGFTLTVPATGTASLKGVIVGARVYNNAAISIAHNTATKLTFNSERYDTDSLHDTGGSTGRLTAPVAGKYDIGGNVSFANSATGIRILYVYLNNATILGRQNINATSGSNTDLVVHTQYELAANDYVELVVFQTSGGDLDVEANSAWSPEFYMSLLSS